MLPNLVVIGARKAGTTSLYHYLALHPEIWMSPEKELDFFLAEGNWARGLDWYERFFPSAVPVRGEASPGYTTFPRHGGVAERMARVLPEARLIYLVRDPIDRLLSHYRMDVATGLERRPLEEALARPGARDYLAESRYWTQLEPYLRHFPAERILVVDRDALLHDRAETLRGVFAFLGVNPQFASPGFDALHMTAPERRRRAIAAIGVRGLNRTLGKAQAFRVRRRVPGGLRAVLTSRLEPPVLEGQTRARIEAILAPELERLRALTGQRFAAWGLG